MKSRFAGSVAAVGLTLAASANAYAATLVVNAKDVIYAAGGNSSAAAADGKAPVDIGVNGGSTLTFAVSGRITLDLTTGDNYNDADGFGAPPRANPSCSTGAGSISGMCAPHAGYLVGVFVPTGGPTGVAPPGLGFVLPGATSFTSLSPELDQVFFIGDGLTGNRTGATQSFIAPPGASLLYLGISDACGFRGRPSCYGDNVGNFTVNVSGAASKAPAVSGVPEPSTWAMMLLGFAGLGYAGFRRSAKGAAL
jgi:hypothetical protein